MASSLRKRVSAALLVVLAASTSATRRADAQELEAGAAPATPPANAPGTPKASDPTTAPPEMTSDKQSRFVYIAAVAGLIAGGIIAYRQKKKQTGG